METSSATHGATLLSSSAPEFTPTASHVPNDVVHQHCSVTSYLSFYMINATSLAKSNAVQQLALDLSQFKANVALVTETWFNSKVTDNCVSIDSYDLYHKDRSKRKGGGVCVYVSNNVQCSVMPYYNSSDCVEALWLVCVFSNVTYCIVCLYHPPDVNTNQLIWRNHYVMA